MLLLLEQYSVQVPNFLPENQQGKDIISAKG
uniref:Uncharacterized protein n=1 Tax=Rhizophora mucronata TaxID=61149 RepID=A0A2P2Q9P5_RHIMU